METFGYFLSEAPVLIFMIWLAVRLVHWRRSRENRAAFNEVDRRMLFHAAQYRPDTWQFYPRFALAVFAVATVGSLQIFVLAPLGAAIITISLVLTSAAIVHGVLLGEK